MNKPEPYTVERLTAALKRIASGNGNQIGIAVNALAAVEDNDEEVDHNNCSD